MVPGCRSVRFRCARRHAIVRRLSTRTSFPADGASLALSASVGNTGARQPRICPVETDATHIESTFSVPPPSMGGDAASPSATERLPPSGGIRVLPVGVAAGIAAGETIERPASVVKELVENALDAGATAVRIDVRGGGLDLIRVGDDGRGIRAADLWLACQRHATSKYPAEGLGAVRTLGFRGEALPSIAGVAELDLVSATGTGAGWRLTLRGGRVLRDEPAPRPCRHDGHRARALRRSPRSPLDLHRHGRTRRDHPDRGDRAPVGAGRARRPLLAPRRRPARAADLRIGRSARRRSPRLMATRSPGRSSRWDRWRPPGPRSRGRSRAPKSTVPVVVG